MTTRVIAEHHAAIEVIFERQTVSGRVEHELDRVAIGIRYFSKAAFLVESVEVPVTIVKDVSTRFARDLLVAETAIVKL
jgi:hypothetical protein